MKQNPHAARTALQSWWQSNPVLVQLLGLGPVLAISTSAVSALGLGAVTLLLNTVLGALLPTIRRHSEPAMLLPILAVTIAGLATILDLWLQSGFYSLYQRIGIFVPLLASQSLIFAFALRLDDDTRPVQGLLQGFALGSAFFAAIVLLGTTRELLTTGAIFADMNLIVQGADWRIPILLVERHFTFIQTAPGAFLCLALVIACINGWRQRNRHRGALVIDDHAGLPRQ